MLADDDNGPDETLDALRDAEDDKVCFSRLKLMGKSPAHYQAYDNRRTTSKDKGSAVHAILTGQRVMTFDKVTASGRAAPRSGKDWEAFKADNADALILSRSEFSDVAGMVASLQSNRGAMELIDGIREESLYFDMMGLACRTTPDARTPGKWFTELKTCQSSDPRRFVNQSFWMGYHAQMALHGIGIKRVTKEGPGDGYVVAVESTAPYPVTVYKMTAKALEAGEKQIRRWMETLKGCLASNQWPPYAQACVDLDVPENQELVFADGGTESTELPF